MPFRNCLEYLLCQKTKFQIFAFESFDVTFLPKLLNLKIERHAIVLLSCQVFAQTATLRVSEGGRYKQ